MKNKMLSSFWILSLLCICLATSLLACNNTNNKTDFNIDNYTINIPYKNNFQILQISDTHWLGNTDWSAHKNFIAKLINNNEIQNNKPDFIVITGDCINDSCMNDWVNYCDFFDSFKIPWTLTFGNHDARAQHSMNELTSYLNERSASSNSYLKFKNNINDNIHGDANFAINLMENNSVKEQLIIFDSNRYRDETTNKGYSDYDYIYPDQIEWYKNLILKTNVDNLSKPIPSLAFFHIPLQEYLFAYESVIRGETDYLDEGINTEGICCPRENTGLFDAMLEYQSTKGIFCGHDHVNYSMIEYKGIKLAYGLKSSDFIYHDQDKLGGRLIVLQEDGNFSSKLIKQSY